MDHQQTWKSFYQSSPRQLVALSRYLQGESMQHLKHTYGYRKLRLHFEPYISLLNTRARRVTELAEKLSISKQACNQVADKLEELGYIHRQSDASDGRAKLLTLTAQGKKLVAEGIHTAHALDEQCLRHINVAQMQNLQKALRLLLNKDRSGQGNGGALLMWLPRLGEETHQRFLRVLMEKDTRLKPSHLECFTIVGGCGGHLKRMAELQGVSVSAVQQLARDLEAWGYVVSDEQGVLSLTQKGGSLLADALAVDAALEQQWQGLLGASLFTAFKQDLACLYEALALPEKMLGQQDRVAALAARLREQLNAEERQRLATLL